MIKIKFRDIMEELLTKIRTNLTSKFRAIENVTEILAFDQEVMRSINIWPIEHVEIKFLLLAMLTQMVPSVSIILSNLNNN